MNRVRVIGWIVAALMMSGCATPKVKYGIFTETEPRKDLESPYADTYMLARTMLTVSRRDSEDGLQQIHTVALRRIEDPTRSFGITPWNRMGVTTRVSLIKVANTQLVESASISVEDKRIEFIGEAFKLLGTVAGVAVSAAPGDTRPPLPTRKFPLEIDTLTLMRATNCQRQKCELEALPKSTNALDVNAKLTVLAMPPDAIEVETVEAALKSEYASGVFFSSACRQATLRVSIPEQDDLVTTFSLADPRYLQLTALPVKGQITAHSECGYSVVPEDVELQSNLKVADSFFDELFKFKKAYDESNAEDDGDDANE